MPTKPSSATSGSLFTVDTHLFRELGQFLVGRESTALIELVKNAYDADAPWVTVYGESLDDPERGYIKVEDGGTGMTLETFMEGFLRIASRMKDTGDRRSRVHKRRFTGAKGIGRLAAHKLARVLEVKSIPALSAKGEPPENGVSARIDWDKVENYETLDKIGDDAISLEQIPPASQGRAGTTIVLRKLRQRWSKSELGRFLGEVEGFRAPQLMREPLPKGVIRSANLFPRPRISETSPNDPGFDVRLEGDFSKGHDYWPVVAQTATWVLEIDAAADKVRYAVVPTSKTLDKSKPARAHTLSMDHPDPERGPFFQARILIREGSGPSVEERAWSQHSAGIRVYMEGFRVLPYGERTDDWLMIERDTNNRMSRLPGLEKSSISNIPSEVEGEGYKIIPNKHYFGAVFLTAKSAPGLTMLVNREGFLPDGNFEVLRRLVRTGIDISTRVRAATELQEKSSDVNPLEDKHSFSELSQQASELRSLAAALPAQAAERVLSVAKRIETTVESSKTTVSSQNMLRILASVGTQFAGFVHEINRLLSMTQSLELAAQQLRDEIGNQVKLRHQAARLAASATELRRVIEKQASYLVDIVTPDARRRRSKQPLAERFDASCRLVDQLAEARGIKIQNQIEPTLKSPAMFPAELTAVFSNLLTNAIKAAGKNGRILAAGFAREGGAIVVRIENTGVAVDLNEAERWFQPFESTTVDVDPVLGQGMGLGLGITRDILSEIGAQIEFVAPSKGYATAVQITFPK